MTINYFLLAAGIIGLCFASGHGYWIQKRIMGEVEVSGMPISTKHSIFVFLHYTTAALFSSAIVLIIASLFSNQPFVHPIAWFIVAINASNFFVFVSGSFARNREELRKGISPIIFMLVWLSIIVAGVIVQ